MVSTKLKISMFCFNVGDQIIPQISLEQLLIGLLFDQAVDLELAVNFVKFFRTILCRTAANGCLWTIIGVVVNVLEIKN